MKNKIYGFNFGDQGQQLNFTQAKFRLKQQALKTNLFDDFYCFDKNILLEKYSHFCTQSLINSPIIGYGAWKPFLFKYIFNKIEKDSIVVYLDSGFTIVNNETALKRFKEYFEMCNLNGGFLAAGDINSQQFPLEILHTKRDTLILMGCDSDEFLYTSQLQSGLLFIKNNELGNKIIDKWEECCRVHHLINYDKSINEEYPDFLAHRDNQSILSLICKKMKLPKECFIEGYEIKLPQMEWFLETHKYPIVTTRLHDGLILHENGSITKNNNLL